MYGLGFAKSRQGPDNSMRSPKGEAWWAVTGSNSRPPGWSSATCANPTLS
jgi:hypothetical protein